MNPLEFEHKYISPDCPVARQVLMLHSILYHSGVRGEAMLMAEHNLHAIVMATTTPYAQLRPERLEYAHGVTAPPVFDVQVMKRQIMDMFSGVSDALGKMSRPPTDEQRERARVRKYRAEIDKQRVLGLAYVRDESRRVQKELFGEVL